MNPNELSDSQGRAVRYIRVSVTDRCNLRCLYCIPSADFISLGHDRILSYEEIERIVTIFAPRGVTSVRITGGEPLVRKHLERLVTSLSEIPEIKDISVTTNGILLGKFARNLKSAGLSRVNISLDTLRPERFEWITNQSAVTERASLDDVLEGLRASREAGLDPVKINVVLMRGFNDDELMDFVALTEENEFEVRFIEFMPMGHNGFWSADRVITADEIISRLRSSIDGLESLGKGRGAGPAQRYRIPDHRGTLGFITPISSEFCVECNRIRLTSDGHVRTCLFSDVETDLLAMMRNGCTDDQIVAAVEKALKSKPDGHNISKTGHQSKCARTMSHIGG
ncbi:MAG: GTP 3',8-cyclase MoaA [bacterium]